MTHTTPSTATREELLKLCDFLIDGYSAVPEVTEYVVAASVRELLSDLDVAHERANDLADDLQQTREQLKRLLSHKTSDSLEQPHVDTVVDSVTSNTTAQQPTTFPQWHGHDSHAADAQPPTRIEQQPAQGVSSGYPEEYMREATKYFARVIKAADTIAKDAWDMVLAHLPAPSPQQQQTQDDGASELAALVARVIETGAPAAMTPEQSKRFHSSFANRIAPFVDRHRAEQRACVQQQGRQVVEGYLQILKPIRIERSERCVRLVYASINDAIQANLESRIVLNPTGRDER